MKTTSVTTKRPWQAQQAFARVYAIENGNITDCIFEGSVSSVRTFLRFMRQREASLMTLEEKI